MISMKYLYIFGNYSVSDKFTKQTEMIINSIFNDHDYVFSSDGGGCYKRFHLITNMFKYNWKYKEIYQCSIWKILWMDMIGFLFKTE